jgi:PAS domain S-box-containing protein
VSPREIRPNTPQSLGWLRLFRLMAVAGVGIAAAIGGGAALALSLAGQPRIALWTAVIGIAVVCGSALYAAFWLDDRIRTLAHRALANEGYRLFVDHSTEGFFRTDAEGRFLEANAALAQICGYDAPEELFAALNRNSESLYLDLQSRAEFAAQMRAQGAVKDFISKIRRRDGKTIWVNESARAVFNAYGRLLFYEGTLHDITVQRESLQAMRQALQQSQEAARAKSAFIAATSHELKTPLNAVIGFSEVMVKELLGPFGESYHVYAGHIYASGQHLLKLINDILDFTRIEGGALGLSETDFALGPVVDEALAAALALRDDPPEIAIKIVSDLPPIRADEKRVLQVLTNLLSNAVKFTPAGGRVTVRCSEGPDGAILIEVADTGIGMDPVRVPIALEPFKQIDGRLARQFEGLGLGLPLAKGLVELHGGHIAISSALGKGTTVNLSFPPERTVRRPASSVAAVSGAMR